jgi:hypothetical protein
MPQFPVHHRHSVFLKHRFHHCEEKRVRICSEPFVNTSVLQINHPIGQWVVPLVNETWYSHLFTTGLGLQMGHPSYKYHASYKYFWCFYVLHAMPYTALFSIIYHAYVFFIPGVWPHLNEARNSFKIFYLPLYLIIIIAYIVILTKTTI